MKYLSNRVLQIQESPTLAVVAKATAMKANGQDVLILAAGEPDFDTPKHIKEAAIAAIMHGKTKYTAVLGIPELRKAIVDKLSRENHLNYPVAQVIVSAGAKNAIYNVLQALISPGDEVIIPTPSWVSYPDMTLLAEGKPVKVSCGMDESFKLSATKLRWAITEKTKAIIFNAPSNPTGMVYTWDELQEIAAVLREYPQVFIISDDIYEHILFAGNKFYNLANVAPDLHERIIIVNGVSKAYAMTGWRIGYAACGNPGIIKAMAKIQSQCISCACSVAQYAAVAALNSGLEPIKVMQQAFTERHDYVVTRLNQIPGISCLRAQGAFYAFFDCSKAIAKLHSAGKISATTDLALASYLLEQHLVACVPGSAFGLEGFMRISFATSMAEITKALNRIETALS